MQSRTAAVVAVALLVAFSDCSALGGSQADGPSDANETEPLTDSETGANGSNGSNSTTTDIGDGTDPNGTDGNAGTDDGNDTANADGTADATWSPPEEPNRPLEDKREDRIDSVEFVDTHPAESGDGYELQPRGHRQHQHGERRSAGARRRGRRAVLLRQDQRGRTEVDRAHGRGPHGRERDVSHRLRPAASKSSARDR